MDLFQNANPSSAPLAHKLRPKNLEEFIGQNKILGPNSPLKKLLLSGKVPNLILWGPPGVGKTTFAELLSQHIDAKFISLNAISAGAKDIRDIGEAAKGDWTYHQKKTFLFMDEVHRLNKSQQDVLLPFIEKGVFGFIGATTENPSYHLNSALLSRTRLVVFEAHSQDSLKQIMNKVFDHYSLKKDQTIKEEVEDLLIEASDGDARLLINHLEFLIDTISSFC